jgi:hypothetical protein
MAKPVLPEFGSGFKALNEKARELWVKARLISESKEPVTTMVSKSVTLDEAIKSFISASDEIKSYESIKENARKVIFDALVKNQAVRMETDSGYAYVEAATQEILDKDYLREVAPEAFAVVPAALRVMVKKPGA